MTDTARRFEDDETQQLPGATQQLAAYVARNAWLFEAFERMLMRSELRLLRYLLLWAGGRADRLCWPSMERICAEAVLCERSLRKAAATLERLGVVRVRRLRPGERLPPSKGGRPGVRVWCVWWLFTVPVDPPPEAREAVDRLVAAWAAPRRARRAVAAPDTQNCRSGPAELPTIGGNVATADRQLCRFLLKLRTASPMVAITAAAADPIACAPARADACRTERGGAALSAAHGDGAAAPGGAAAATALVGAVAPSRDVVEDPPTLRSARAPDPEAGKGGVMQPERNRATADRAARRREAQRAREAAARRVLATWARDFCPRVGHTIVGPVETPQLLALAGDLVDRWGEEGISMAIRLAANDPFFAERTGLHPAAVLLGRCEEALRECVRRGRETGQDGRSGSGWTSASSATRTEPQGPLAAPQSGVTSRSQEVAEGWAPRTYGPEEAEQIRRMLAAVAVGMPTATT